MVKKNVGAIIGLMVASLVSGIGGVALLANDSWIFGIGLSILAGVLAGASACNIKDNDKLFTITGVVVFIIVLAIGMIMHGVNSSDSGVSWGDLTDEEKENARWAYEVKEAIDDWD